MRTVKAQTTFNARQWDKYGKSRIIFHVIALACAKEVVVVCKPLCHFSLQKEASKKLKVLIASTI